MIVKAVFLIACFVVTYCAGVLTGLRLAHRKVDTREVKMQVRSVRSGLEHVNRWVDHWLALILVLIFAVAAYSVVVGSRNHNADKRANEIQSACLAAYANQLYDALTPRQSASEALQTADNAFNTALVHLLRIALAPGVTIEARHAGALRLARAAQHKQQVAHHLSAERAANPYPAPPKEACPR